jgi:hypothetical protein
MTGGGGGGYVRQTGFHNSCVGITPPINILLLLLYEQRAWSIDIMTFGNAFFNSCEASFGKDFERLFSHMLNEVKTLKVKTKNFI